jgi:hypothetical protein
MHNHRRTKGLRTRLCGECERRTYGIKSCKQCGKIRDTKKRRNLLYNLKRNPRGRQPNPLSPRSSWIDRRDRRR